VLAAAVNALLLFGVGFHLLYGVYERFRAPPDVLSGPMLAVAVAGLAATWWGSSCCARVRQRA
jgi:cobalt-zinc-cadmium efflux system protein